jgi:serine/threonine-protein kinase
MMAVEAGTRVGLYEVIEQLGRGGMATVFKARHTVLERDAALKFLDLAFLEDPEFVKRFRHEARVIAGLEHPNIVPVFDFSEHEGLPYLVMKFVEGETLKARLGRGRLTMAESSVMIQAIGSGLSYAHAQGVLHRDVKPSNVLLGRDGSIYLADFGLARIAASAQSTLSREFMIGTPQYISPEQARSEPNLDARTDIYSFGILIYELLVGQVPFDADTPISIIHDHLQSPPPRPSARAPGISEDLDRAILRALAKDKKDRFGSVDEMVEAVRRGMGAAWTALPTPTRPASPVQPKELPETLKAGPPPSEPAVERSEKAAPDSALGSPVQQAEKAAVGPAHEPAVQQADTVGGAAAVLECPGGPTYPLSGDNLLIGRRDPRRGISPDIDLTEAEPLDPKTGKRRRTVHREQARLKRKGSEWTIQVPREAAARSLLNNNPITANLEYLLHDGDSLTFGAVELILRL